MNGTINWRRVGRIAFEIATCEVCSRAAIAMSAQTDLRAHIDLTPQPPWIGPSYRRGGVVLLGINPSPAGQQISVRATQFRSELNRFVRSQGSAAGIRRWSSYRINDLPNWNQYGVFR